MHRSLLLAVPAVVAALAVGTASGSASTSSAPAAHASAVATVKVTHGHLGTFLVNSNGRTLYLFAADKGTKSACTGECAKAWPPLRTTGKPKASAGVKASLLGTAKRADGSTQVT